MIFVTFLGPEVYFTLRTGVKSPEKMVLGGNEVGQETHELLQLRFSSPKALNEKKKNNNNNKLQYVHNKKCVWLE